MNDKLLSFLAWFAITFGTLGGIYAIHRYYKLKELSELEFKSYKSDSVTFTVQYRGDTLKSFSMHKGKERVYLYLNTK